MTGEFEETLRNARMEVGCGSTATSKSGWSISALARQLGVSRLPVRGYLNGEGVPGQRARAATDPFEEYVSCCRLRLSGDPRAWLTTLFDEVAQLGYAGSYQSFTRAMRTRSPRPRCEACRQARVVHDAARGCSRRRAMTPPLPKGDSPGAGDQVPTAAWTHTAGLTSSPEPVVWNGGGRRRERRRTR
jgi:hypothetical protein